MRHTSAARCAITITEWESRDPDSHPKQLGQQSLDADQDTLDTVKKLAQTGVLSVQELKTGLAVRASSYVGTITLGRVQITICPKIKGRQLLWLLKYAAELHHFRRYPLSPVAIDKLGFQDLLILQLVAEVRDLLLHGLHRKYTAIEEDLVTLRGRIDFQRLARRGGVAQAHLPCRHHPRLENCLINQVLLEGLHLGIRLSRDAKLKNELHPLVVRFQDQVSRISLKRHVWRQLDRESNRLVGAYRPSLEIVKILSQSQGISLEEELPIQKLRGFLIDMNRFFQTLMSRFLRENVTEGTVIDEYPIRSMMSYLVNPKQRPRPILRPDFVVKKRDEIVIILDTKYRDLWEPHLPREMLYQLGMYALSQHVGVPAVILYPTTSAEAHEQVIAVSGLNEEQQRAHIILRPVDLNRLQHLIEGTASDDPVAERREYANALVSTNW